MMHDGLTCAEADVLESVCKLPCPTTREVTEASGYAYSTVRRALSELRDRDMVTSRPSVMGDPRVKVHNPTKAGRRVLES